MSSTKKAKNVNIGENGDKLLTKVKGLSMLLKGKNINDGEAVLEALEAYKAQMEAKFQQQFEKKE